MDIHIDPTRAAMAMETRLLAFDRAQLIRRPIEKLLAGCDISDRELVDLAGAVLVLRSADDLIQIAADTA